MASNLFNLLLYLLTIGLGIGDAAQAGHDYILDIHRIVLTDLDKSPVQPADMNLVQMIPPQGRMFEDEAIDMEATGRLLDEAEAVSLARSMKCGFCKTNLTVGDSGEITSPEFPDPYTPNVDCLWLMETAGLDDRILLDCDTIDLEPCGSEQGSSPSWRDYLVISPLWNFKRSWVYCGNATSVAHVKHTSLCHKMAVSFRSNNNHNCMKGFRCTYTII